MSDANPPPSAADMIDTLRARHKSWRATSDHVAVLAADARTNPLAEILTRLEFSTMTASYQGHSDTAVVYQTAQRKNARRAATLGFGATLVAALMLYLGVTSSGSVAGTVLTGLYGVLIVAALAAGGYVTYCKPYRRWITERSAAEQLRIRYFQRVLSAATPVPSTPGTPLSPALLELQLEYVRAFLMDDQRDWFARSAKDAARDVKRAKHSRLAAYTLVVAASLPFAFSFLGTPEVSSHLPAWFSAIVAAISGVGTDLGIDAKLLALTGVAGGAMQTLLTSLSAMSLADRNAIVYARMVTKLDKIAAKHLPTARAAAAAGTRQPIEAFWRDLSFALMAEHEGWGDALNTAQLLTLDKLSPVESAGD